MQAVGMLRGTRAIYSLVILTTLIGYARPLPLQLLPSIPGYIPVYIRHGDEPLIDINPALAEAFHEDLAIPKNHPLDNTADIPDGGIKEDDGFIEKSNKDSNHLSDVHTSEIRKHAPTKEQPYKMTVDMDTDMHIGVSKILPDELHDFENKHYQAEHREGLRPNLVSKGAVVKVNPLSEAEKEELDRFRIRIEKQQPQDDPHRVLPAEQSDRSKLSRDFAPVISFGDAPGHETKDAPRIRLLPVSVEAATNDGDSSVSEKKAIVKLQRGDVPRNVHKLLPVDAAVEKAERETIAGMERGGSREEKPEDQAVSDDKAN